MSEFAALAASMPSVPSQVSDLALAVVLTGAVGLDRQVRDKSAGLRTHAVIGLGAALFVLLSKYGFFDVLSPQRVVLDPSRVAAQIASGIGFVGAGLIFVRRGDVKGLTSAAAIWLTAAIGAAAGAGMVAAPLLATGGYFLVVVVFTWAEHSMQRFRSHDLELGVVYRTGTGALKQTFATCDEEGFERLSLTGGDEPEGSEGGDSGAGVDGSRCSARILLRGRGPAETLVALLRDIPGVEQARVQPRVHD